MYIIFPYLQFKYLHLPYILGQNFSIAFYTFYIVFIFKRHLLQVHPHLINFYARAKFVSNPGLVSLAFLLLHELARKCSDGNVNASKDGRARLFRREQQNAQKNATKWKLIFKAIN
ncbi:hypothetical protein ACQ4LE_010189 [Meloidogyne hapla]